MYNRYIPVENRYETVKNHEGIGAGHRKNGEGIPRGQRVVGDGFVKGKGGLGSIFSGLGDGLGDGIGQTVDSLLRSFHLENIDTGDILLALIVLFLILEDGDNLDLIITLGLMILFSLGEQ